MKILLTGNRHGGTAAVLQVAAKLTEIGAACVGLTAARSAPGYDAAGDASHHVDSPVGALEARHPIAIYAPDLLLAATSEPDDCRVGRLYSPEELTRLLEEHGLITELICGDFGGGACGLDSKAIVVAARLEPKQA